MERSLFPGLNSNFSPKRPEIAVRQADEYAFWGINGLIGELVWSRIKYISLVQW